MSNELNQVVLAFSECPCFVAQDTPGPYNQRELAGIWLDWVAELSADSVRNYDLVLLCPTNAELPESVKAWGKLTRFPENHAIASWPLGPNRVFQQVLWFYHHKKLRGPFFWVEADCVPLTPDWIDAIANEYRRGDKPFMGAIVEPNPPKNKAPRHMTGNAVYPENAYLLAPRLMEAHHTAWDVHAAGQILRQAHPTNLIQHDWRCPEIRDRDDLRSRLQPKAVLFHSDKFGAIPKVLGQRNASVLDPAFAKPDDPEGIPILEYAASKGITAADLVGAGQNELAELVDKRVHVLTSSSCFTNLQIDDTLRLLKEISETDSLNRTKIAKFMVVNGIVNQGHCSAYLGGKKEAKRKTPAKRRPIEMTDEEFQKRVNAKKSNVPASTAA
jgi:hypothetical protein